MSVLKFEWFSHCIKWVSSDFVKNTLNMYIILSGRVIYLKLFNFLYILRIPNSFGREKNVFFIGKDLKVIRKLDVAFLCFFVTFFIQNRTIAGHKSTGLIQTNLQIRSAVKKALSSSKFCQNVFKNNQKAMKMHIKQIAYSWRLCGGRRS